MHRQFTLLNAADTACSFNSPYLGFFLASLHRLDLRFSQPGLSIPLTWDFSLHQSAFKSLIMLPTHFQFPLLGIFPCISMLRFLLCKPTISLSIPLTWDFSLHRRGEKALAGGQLRTFNSPYLGFFLASPLHPSLPSPHHHFTFNSPYLGFFLASFGSKSRTYQRGHLSIPLTWDFSLHPSCTNVGMANYCRSFNSPYLGFFLASATLNQVFVEDFLAFNSPYLGFFLASAPRLGVIC